MKICYLSHATNYHTIKWCNYFVNLGYEVHLISFEEGNIYGVKVHVIKTGTNRTSSDLSKLKYLTSSKQIKNIVNKINPDIVHVHYATSYGISCALSGIKGYFLSVWGSDIYEFPKKSILHKYILKYSLSKAGKILSTSKDMKKETEKLTKKNIYVTPFGVDTKEFKKIYNKSENKDKFVIGLIKSLDPKYGIKDLLQAFKLFVENNPNIKCELRIAGDGKEKEELIKLAKKLGISEKVVWLGFIQKEKVIEELNKFDICVIPSLIESFGVSAVEAQACEVPVIVTNVGGLPEATNPNISSLVVKPNNPKEIYEKIQYLYENKEIRRTMGRKGREYVKKNFELKDNFKYIDDIYKEYLKKKKFGE